MELIYAVEISRTEENLLLEVKYSLSSFWSKKKKMFVREVFYEIKYGISIFRDTGESTESVGLYHLLQKEADRIINTK